MDLVRSIVAIYDTFGSPPAMAGNAQAQTVLMP